MQYANISKDTGRREQDQEEKKGYVRPDPLFRGSDLYDLGAVSKICHKFKYQPRHWSPWARPRNEQLDRYGQTGKNISVRTSWSAEMSRWAPDISIFEEEKISAVSIDRVDKKLQNRRSSRAEKQNDVSRRIVGYRWNRMIERINKKLSAINPFHCSHDFGNASETYPLQQQLILNISTFVLQEHNNCNKHLRISMGRWSLPSNRLRMPEWCRNQGIPPRLACALRGVFLTFRNPLAR